MINLLYCNYKKKGEAVITAQSPGLRSEGPPARLATPLPSDKGRDLEFNALRTVITPRLSSARRRRRRSAPGEPRPSERERGDWFRLTSECGRKNLRN